jgi:uncharacterized protein YjbJ (UPF0337 family)
MDSDRIEGMGHQVKGAVKQALGKLIGDAKITTDGAAEQAGGNAQVAAAPNSGHVLGIDSDRIKGIAHQLEGAVKEGLGSLMDNSELRQAGIAEREAGRVQNAAGGVRDAAREATEEGK